MGGHFGQRDLLDGGAAAAMLLLTIAIGLTPWLAIPLAAVTYAGLVMLRSRPELDENVDEANWQHHLAFQKALANTEAIRALQPQIAKPSARDQVSRILDGVEQVLAVMREDGNLAATPILNDHLLLPTRSLLTEYVRLSNRGISDANDLLEKTETYTLPRIERTIDTFYERLHRSHVVDLATFDEVLDLNLESIAATSSRRLTP